MKRMCLGAIMCVGIVALGCAYAQQNANNNCMSDESMYVPYNFTVTLPFVDHGWFLPCNQQNIERLLARYKPQVVVELGSWLGCSTMFIASRLQMRSKLYAVDTWLGSPEHYANPEFSRLLPDLYLQFLSNIKHKKLTDIIVPVRMMTLEAARALDVMPDFMYVDASHEEEDVFKDIMAWYPKLAQQGIMCGDDWNWPSVRRGIERAACELGQQVTPDDNFWEFKPKP